MFPARRTWHAWSSGYGASDRISGNAVTGSATQNAALYGGAMGADYQLTEAYRIGVAVGGSNSSFNIPNRGTSGSVAGGSIGVYSLSNFGAFYAASTSSFSYYSNTTTRLTGGFGGLASETDRGGSARGSSTRGSRRGVISRQAQANGHPSSRWTSPVCAPTAFPNRR